MSIEKAHGYVEAQRAYEANLSLRAKHIIDLERYVECKQYDGLPDWFSDEKPLWERAPCIVYPAVENAIKSNADLVLGEGRFPLASAEGLESATDAETFEALVKKVIKVSRLRSVAREVFGSGQGASSACAIFGVRGGRLFIETARAWWCEVERDAEGATRRLVIQYPYVATEKVGGTLKAVARLYRRVIDDKTDVTYKPADARVDGIEPKWEVDEKVEHNLGFCPVVWYAHMKGCSVVGDIDGRAIHENLSDEIRAHDFALSQRHRAALQAGDPQWTEIGVEPGYNPSGKSVRKPDVPASLHGKPGEPVTGGYVSRGARGKARKKSPGTIWQYENPDTKVQLHCLPGDALEALENHASDLRIKLAESLGVVFLDPETLPTATTLSGRALEALKSRQLDRCDNYRDDFGDHFLLPAIGMLLRIAVVKKLAIKGVEVIAKIIKAAGDQWSWYAPPLELTWGRYFRLDPEEEGKMVETAIKAKDGGVATTRAAVEKLRDVFGVKDVDAYLKELEAEKAEAMKRQHELAASAFNAQGALDDGTEDDGGTPPRRGRSSAAGEAGEEDG